MSEYSQSTWRDDTQPYLCETANMPTQRATSIPSAVLPKARRRGLNRFSRLRACLVGLKVAGLRHIWGMDIHPTVQLSLRARLDRTFPKGIHVGAHTYIAFDACILTHDRTRGLYLDTWVGANCFVGARAIILPGVRIGEGAIVGAGAVVTKDVPSKCAVAGNPARIIQHGLSTGLFGRLAEADMTEAGLARAGKT